MTVANYFLTYYLTLRPKLIRLGLNCHLKLKLRVRAHQFFQ